MPSVMAVVVVVVVLVVVLAVLAIAAAVRCVRMAVVLLLCASKVSYYYTVPPVTPPGICHARGIRFSPIELTGS